jgi:molecular chaperone GrpE (heat shock protein)
MLNWRRDPDYEQRMNALAIRIQQTRNETEEIKRETELIKIESAQIESETERIRRETEQIRRETERLRQENARLKTLNIKTQSLLSSVDQLCFPPESSSIPAGNRARLQAFLTLISQQPPEERAL